MDHKDNPVEQQHKQDHMILPNLMNAVGGNTGAQSAMTNKKGTDQSMEIMMMKRLNYIRNNLDLSNPRETTSKIRVEAK